MTKSLQKPDTLRQSEGFEELHGGLPVERIKVPREQLTTCRSHDVLSKVAATGFDYLPVENAKGHFVGLLATKDVGTATRRVKERMCPLSEADLIPADATILDLLRRVRQKPFLVVGSGGIDGLVAWTDLQKLPVRTALFALVTGFELTMYEAIKREFGDGDDWLDDLQENRRKCAKALFEDRKKEDSHVDLLLCTQFCDKGRVLIESFKLSKLSGSKTQLRKRLKAIEDVRNNLAHANNYAMTLEEAERLRDTVRDLVEFRSEIQTARRVDPRSASLDG